MSERKYYSKQAQNQVEREKLLLALIATMCGVGIGAIIALIFAPQDGEETRNQLGDALGNVGHDLSNTADRVKSEVQDRVNSMVKN